jgi:hypothetical protein
MMIRGLCLSVIGAICNQGRFTMYTAKKSNTRRANIADYEVPPTRVALLEKFESSGRIRMYGLEKH